MSREIKFRAFFPKGRYTWIIKEGEDDRLDYTGVPVMKNVELEEQYSDTTDYYICSRDGIIMQYIGLKDKNGVEIYEGDILAYEEKEKDYVVGVCVYDPIISGYFIQKENNPKGGGVWSFKQAKVIGNIYQNSNLLK